MPRILEDCTNSIEIKKSKFITYLHRTDDPEEAKDFLKQIKKEHWNATHHCSAMIIGQVVRSNDDGEPNQTAGHPMLDVLLHHDMQDILAVVVRYFGGTKLGTGGLVRAYSSSVQLALEQAILTQEQKLLEYEITFSYDWIGKLDSYFHRNHIEVGYKEYQEQVIYQYFVQSDNTKDIHEITNGTITPILLQEVIQETPIER